MFPVRGCYIWKVAKRTKSEYTAAMPITATSLLSPLEQSCLEFVRDVRRLGKIDPTSPEGIALLRKIAERRAAYALPACIQLPPGEAPDAPTRRVDIDASAEEGSEIRKPPVRAMKWRGEIAQVKFAAKAMSHNLGVAILLTDCLPFDDIVITPKRLYRVQVKSTGTSRFAGWQLILHHKVNGVSGSRYTADDFDVLAAVVPGDVWYLFPQSVVAGLGSLHLPRRERLRYRAPAIANIEQYRERWDLFE